MTDDTRQKPEPSHRWAEKLAERKERYQDRSRLYRVGWVMGGVIVTLAGVAMLVTPGPAFVVIPLGLAMLAMEFAWAEHALEKALIQAEKAQQKAKEADTRSKVATAITIVLVIAAVLGGIFYWDINVPLINPS